MGIRKPPTDPLIVHKLIDELETQAKAVANDYRAMITNKDVSPDERDRQLDEMAKRHKELRAEAETLRESIALKIRKKT